MTTDSFGDRIRIVIALMLLNMCRIDLKCSKWTLGLQRKRGQEKKKKLFCSQDPLPFRVMKKSSGWQICAHVSLFPYNRSGFSVAPVIFTLVPGPRKMILEYKKIQMKMMLPFFYTSGKSEPFKKRFCTQNLIILYHIIKLAIVAFSKCHYTRPKVLSRFPL